MTAGYIYAGRITEVVANGVMLTVPLLAGAAPQGPIETSVPDLAVGDRVIVSNLGDSADALVVLGRLPGRPSSIAEIPNLQSRLVAIEGVNTTQNGRLDSLESRANTNDTANTSQNNRLTSVEGRATNLETRATSIEGVNTTQNNRLTAVESKNSDQDTRLTAAEGSVTTLRADTAGRATTKGDLLVATAAGTLTRQAVGSTGQILVPDAASPTGVSWVDPTPTLPFALGVIGRNRRTTEVSTSGTTSAQGVRIISCRAAVKPGRLYELRYTSMVRNSTANTKTVLSLMATTNDVEPTVNDPVVQQKIVDNGPITGTSVIAPLDTLWATSSEVFLRITLVMSVTGGTTTLSAGTAVPCDIWIADVGPNVAPGGGVP